jgi:hypothetical protein
MGQKSRVVTVIDGVEVIEMMVMDPDGDPIETRYYVSGEKYDTLREARDAAKKIAEDQ